MAVFAPRYARAFAEVVEADGMDVAAAQQQMRDFADTLAGSRELREVLMNPSIEMGQKLKVLDAVSEKIGMFPKVRNFMAVIVEHHRLGELNEILAVYSELADEDSGATEAQITSAHPLNAEDRVQLEARIATLAGARVRASYTEDASLLGGAIVQIGSTVYDGSIRAQLQQLKATLVHA
jgi:F-type H+-transporting ATPase subunit delta